MFRPRTLSLCLSVCLYVHCLRSSLQQPREKEATQKDNSRLRWKKSNFVFSRIGFSFSFVQIDVYAKYSS